MAVHPPAMGGKTAWGVTEVISRPADNPAELVKMQKLQNEFDAREEERLKRLKDLDKQASHIAADRKIRRLEYQPASTNADDFKKRQDDILRNMLERREKRRQEKIKRKREGLGREKKEKKTKRSKDTSSSSTSSDSASSSSESSSSKDEGSEKQADKQRPVDTESRQALADAESKRKAEDPEAKRRAEEAKARARDLKRKAKEAAVAWAAEAKRKEAEMEAKRQLEAKQRIEEAEAKRQAEIKRKAEEAEAKRKLEEATTKVKSGESDNRKKLFKIEKRKVGDVGDRFRKETVAGGFYKGQRVIATQDITVRGNIVVKAGTAGSVVGPAESDPTARISVRFLQREDHGLGNLNVVPREIKKG